MKPSRIPSLDGLRAISIAIVIVGHVALQQSISAQSARYFELLASLGVRVFFVISGFLITGLLLNELDTNGSIHLLKFYFRRTFRIFPPYYALILLLVVLQTAGVIILAPHDAFRAFTYTSNYYPERSWYLGHSWSLSVEEQFYLLFPATLLLLGKKRGLVVAAFLIVLCPVIRWVVRFYPPFAGYETGKTFETVADALAIGCVLAGAQTWLHDQALYRRLLASKVVIVVPLVVIFFTLMQSGRPSVKGIAFTGVSIGIALCIDWAVTYHNGVVGKLLNATALTFIGLMSYSIYLWQQVFLHPHSPYLLARFPLNIIAIAFASLASYYFIERPSLCVRQRLEKVLFPRCSISSPNHSLRSVPAQLNSSKIKLKR